MLAKTIHIETGKLKTFSKMIRPISKEIYPLAVIRKISIELKTNNEEEVIPSGKIKMPSQPQGYIKCPRYDFF